MNTTPAAASIVIAPDGAVETVNLNTSTNRLQLMYDTLSCTTVDVVRLTTKIDMWLDDNGLYTSPVNPVATALARHYEVTPGSHTTAPRYCAQPTPPARRQTSNPPKSSPYSPASTTSQTPQTAAEPCLSHAGAILRR
jgi:hypothetical protein